MANRILYGYFPTKWRRWPMATLAAAPSTPEEVPTPAQEPEQPEATPETEPEFGPTDADLPPPLPEEPTAPSDSDEPSEEPLTPSMAPGGGTRRPTDQPPSPPFGDTLPGLPPAQEPADGAAPTRPSLEPSPDLFPSRDSAPPTMPQDDPFKDDPEPGSDTLEPKSGANDEETGSSDVASRPALIRPLPLASESEPHQATFVERRRVAPAAGFGTSYEPRLLSQPAEPAEAAAPVPHERSVYGNPLRSGSAGVRQASSTQAPAPASFAGSQESQRTWRRNPLRAE